MGHHAVPYLEPDPRYVPANRRDGWSSEDAKSFLEWSMSRMEARSEALLKALDVQFCVDPGRLTAQICGPLVKVLKHEGFRGAWNSGGEFYEATPYTLSIAFDLGLLMCRSVLRVADPTFVATVLRRPKSDVSFNKLVIRPSDDRWQGATWCPEGGAGAIVHHMIHKTRDPMLFVSDMRDIVARVV